MASANVNPDGVTKIVPLSKVNVINVVLTHRVVKVQNMKIVYKSPHT